jgi:hypothetical protein
MPSVLPGRPVVEVELRAGRPVRVRLRGRWQPVLAVVEAWVSEGRWWGREERRLYLRLHTAAGTLDLCRLGATARDGVEAWGLERVLD